MMCKYTETMSMPKVENANLLRLQCINAEPDIDKRKWIHKYSHRLLKLWMRWQSPLGVAPAYTEQIEEELAKYYDEPLKRIFIETTYH